MKKQLILLIVAVLLICVGLSGCSRNAPEYKIKGIWVGSTQFNCNGINYTLVRIELRTDQYHPHFVMLSFIDNEDGNISGCDGTYEISVNDDSNGEENELLTFFCGGCLPIIFDYRLDGNIMYLNDDAFTKQ